MYSSIGPISHYKDIPPQKSMVYYLPPPAPSSAQEDQKIALFYKKAPGLTGALIILTLLNIFLTKWSIPSKMSYRAGAEPS